MTLTQLWFLIIAFLWLGYFVLEGFDFGVGMLLPVVGRDETDRRVAINTIGPVWDGNEVWLIVAGASIFAAFPEWYATLFSGFYLPLLIILLALIARGVAFEFRGKRDDPRWRARWDFAIIAGSALPALLWGVAFGNIVRGIPMDARHEFVGNLGTLLNPYALLFGLTTLTLFGTHGAMFLALKTHGPVRDRARRVALPVGLVAAVAAVAFLAWTQVRTGTVLSGVVAAGAAVALLVGLAATRRGRDGVAFAGTAAAIGLAVVSLFAAIYPDVLPATDPAHSLTIHNASSTPYTLRVMSWVALAFTPFVLAYQTWSYWVFRRRLGRHDIAQAAE
ncbi:cytochrome c oxidase assembly protein [Actinocatenispora thailandica]|uniref:Cytochrome c oxidase assembly protein n=1 Tax=Actinocatenispora thailandica TaxID=227318 RepID=A0A7R7HX61_9ACTN|nr:cytochrome d ubiquinol oxidase subunit II [Actinocatenispora thailandica]BCJ35391.1 cytochrome c oxidase assembly protein [Actinocatenispora thailandica]